MLLNAKQHVTLAHYVRTNQQQQRDAGRSLANPAWQMKRAQSFLTLARMTAKRTAGAASRVHKPRLPHATPAAHGVTKSLAGPQMGPATGRPASLAPRQIKPNAAPPEITGTPAQFGAGMLRMQGAVPGANLPGAPGATPPFMDAGKPVMAKLPALPRIR